MPAPDDAEAFIARVPADGSTIGNQKLREALGGAENRYESTKNDLVEAGKPAKGQGRGDTVRRAQAQPRLARKRSPWARPTRRPRAGDYLRANASPQESRHQLDPPRGCPRPRPGHDEARAQQVRLSA